MNYVSHFEARKAAQALSCAIDLNPFHKLRVEDAVQILICTDIALYRDRGMPMVGDVIRLRGGKLLYETLSPLLESDPLPAPYAEFFTKEGEFLVSEGLPSYYGELSRSEIRVLMDMATHPRGEFLAGVNETLNDVPWDEEHPQGSLVDPCLFMQAAGWSEAETAEICAVSQSYAAHREVLK